VDEAHGLVGLVAGVLGALVKSVWFYG